MSKQESVSKFLDGVKVWVEGYTLYIHTDRPETVYIYTYSGKVQGKFNMSAGNQEIELTEGNYLVWVGQQCFRVQVG